jgi:ectoine hydroxylase-related dioxygenase (phytanoyl-CoA dioxygenase family)
MYRHERHLETSAQPFQAQILVSCNSFLSHSFSTASIMTTSPKLQRLDASAGRDAVLKAVREDGAVIIKGLFTKDQIRRLNEEVQPAVDNINVGSSHTEEWVREFHGDNTKRLNNIVSHSNTFRHEILESPLIHEICEKIYLEDAGGYWMNSAQVIDIGPGSKAQPLHRDQWQFPIFTHAGPNAPEASINFVVALTDFTDANGATRVIPGSHLWNDFSQNGTPEHTIPAEMDVGDACFITGKVVHGGGANVTTDITRRAITLVFQCSYLTPEEAYPFLVDKKIANSLTPRGQRMIGFRSQFLKDSPGVWKSDYGMVDEVYC